MTPTVRSDASTDTLLEVKDLRVVTNGPSGRLINLVDSVSFSITEGEVFCLVGESGSGKSLTMSAIMGVLPPGVWVESGEVLLRGTDLLRLSDKERRSLLGRELAMVFQDPLTALNPVTKVGHQIARMIQVHDKRVGRAEARRRVVDLLTSVGVPRPEVRAKTYPHQWSGGMRQRAVIAMAIANSPGLLIADEPTTALDVTIQAQVMQVLARAREMTGAALALITHDLGLVAQVADRVAIMYAGKIIESGTVLEIFRRPRHPYTQGLLASVLKVEAVGQRAVAIPGSPPASDERPRGCSFHPRCALGSTRPQCQEDVPELLGDQEGHEVACFLASNTSEPLGVSR